MPNTDNNIYKLFSKFRHNVKQPSKSKEGYGYNYADLPTLQAVVHEALPEGLEYYQNVSSSLEDIVIKTIFFDNNGKTIESGELHLPQTKSTSGKMNNIQAIGAAITYGRRYQLAGMAGVSSEEDVDGMDKPNYQSNKKNTPVKANTKVSKKYPSNTNTANYQSKPPKPQDDKLRKMQLNAIKILASHSPEQAAKLQEYRQQVKHWDNSTLNMIQQNLSRMEKTQDQTNVSAIPDDDLPF